MSTNLSGNILTLGSTSINEETLKAIKSYYYVPDNCSAGDTVILDGIECLCVATGVTIQGSDLTRIAVDKNYDLGYYQKYVGMNIDGATISTIVEWRWGGYYTGIGTSNNEGYGLQNTIKCLANKAVYTKGGSSNNNTCPLMWLGVNDFRSSHSDKWFVPSANELKNYVYPYKSSLTFDTTTGGPSNDYFWSSSEYDGDYANYVYFRSGSIDEFAKFAALSVRLCRAF